LYLFFGSCDLKFVFFLFGSCDLVLEIFYQYPLF
jgi:hypothetical protein